MRRLLVPTVLVALFMFVAVGLAVGWRQGEVSAENSIVRYYVTTETVVTDEFGSRVVPYLPTQFGTETWKWESVGRFSPFYVLRVTAPLSRHNTLFPDLAAHVGDDLPAVHQALRTRIETGALRVKVNDEWRRLKALGCTVPNDPVELVGFGGVRCP